MEIGPFLVFTMVAQLARGVQTTWFTHDCCAALAALSLEDLMTIGKRLATAQELVLMPMSRFA